MQVEIDQANAAFWNELCGSGLARHLGIKDHSQESLARFDQAYFDMYPYLLPLINLDRMKGKRVLEIGLGYGSVGAKIAEAGATYQGLDIASNAASMMNHRLRLRGLPGQAVQGSALGMPFPNEQFDYVVSIGCFHHTGNVQRCLDETYRVLKPAGSAILMVYNQFSFRQWNRWPLRTLGAFLADWTAGWRRSKCLTREQRYAYDANAAGDAAPETSLFSVRQLRGMLKQFEHVAFSKQNSDPLAAFGRVLLDRPKLLSSLGRLLGLDVYFECRKPGAVVLRNAA